MTDTPGGSTAARLIRVLQELGTIEKNGTAPPSMGGYKFRRIEDVTAALKPLFALHGIICLPDVRERETDVRQTSSGKPLYAVNLHVRWTFYNEDDHADVVVGSTWGEGTDSGDKATQKAVTAALKSFLTPTFLISDEGDDSEAHDVPATAAAPTTVLLEGWADPKEMTEDHQKFSEGVGTMHDDDKKLLAQFRAAQGIPWPMSKAQMDTMLEKVVELRKAREEPKEAGFDADESPLDEPGIREEAQAAADGPGGQDINAGK